MPKDQPCLSKPRLCASSSKNAKDKSNTLLAIRNTEDAVRSRGRGSCYSSEKDSGYSDVSDWQQTDVEDRQSNTSRSRGNEHPEPPPPDPKQEPEQQRAGNPSLTPAGGQLSPSYISNMVLKEPDLIQKRRPLSRGSISRVTGSPDAAHVILLQQPSLFLTTLQLHKPPSRKDSTTRKTTEGTYLPILNSYPRIAPHPSKKPPDKATPNEKSQTLSKRVCPEHKSDRTAVTSCLPEQHLHKQPKLQASASGMPRSSSTRDSLSSSSPTLVSSTLGSSSGSSLYTTTTSLLSTRGLHRNNSTNTRHRRFLNTVEILRQSGLLDITLRTKELLRQSNATERDIAQLRQHTELLCRAASNPSCSLNDVTAREHLHRSMAASGSYPNLLDVPVPPHVGPPSQTESLSTGDASKPLAADKSEVPLSRSSTSNADPHQNCPVPQQSHSGQGRNHGRPSSKKGTFTPPDSSTG